MYHSLRQNLTSNIVYNILLTDSTRLPLLQTRLTSSQ